MGRLARRLLIALAPLLVAGCAGDGMGRDFVAPDIAAPNELEVAVIPFENLSSYPSAGRIVAQLVATELYQRRVFHLMEATELRRRERERDLTDAALGRSMVAAEFARAIGVDAVLLGSVSEYGYQHGLHEEPKVGINLRLVRAGDGTVLWASSYSDAGHAYLRRETLNAVAQRAVMRMVDALERKLARSGG